MGVSPIIHPVFLAKNLSLVGPRSLELAVHLHEVLRVVVLDRVDALRLQELVEGATVRLLQCDGAEGDTGHCVAELVVLHVVLDGDEG